MFSNDFRVEFEFLQFSRTKVSLFSQLLYDVETSLKKERTQRIVKVRENKTK